VGEAGFAALVDAPAWARTLAAADRLPPVFSWGMIEVRLAGPGPVDLLGCVADQGDRPLLDAIPCVDERVRRWGTGQWGRALPQLWFEWDQARVDAPPLVWFGVDPGFYDGAHDGREAEHAGAVLGLSAAGRASVERVAAALRGRGRLLGVGTLGPRGLSRVRLFAQLPRDQARRVLVEAGYPGVPPLGEWLAVVPPGEPGYVQLELADGLGEYLALEVRQSRPEPADAWRRRLLAMLVERGLADAARAQRVLEWPGRTPLGPGRWLERSFHLKLRVAGGPPEAKAYLGFTTVQATA